MVHANDLVGAAASTTGLHEASWASSPDTIRCQIGKLRRIPSVGLESDAPKVLRVEGFGRHEVESTLNIGGHVGGNASRNDLRDACSLADS